MDKRCYYKFSKLPTSKKAESVKYETFRIIGDGRMVAAEEKFYKRIGSKDSKKVSAPNMGDRGDTTRYNPISKYESSKLVFDCSDDEKQAVKQVMKSMKHFNRNTNNNYYKNEMVKKTAIKRIEYYKRINDGRAPQNTINDAASSSGSSRKCYDINDDLKSETGRKRKIIIVPTQSRNIINGRLKTVDFAEECVKNDSITVKIPYWTAKSDTEAERKRKKDIFLFKRKSFESITSIEIPKKNQSFGRLVRKKNSNKRIVRKPTTKDDNELFPKIQIDPDCCTKYTSPIYESWFDLNWTSKPRNDYLSRILDDTNTIKAIKIDDDFTFDELRFEEKFTGKIKFTR